ncbi:trigger factor [Sphingorhabdus pulchriflava]|uniref:Trigger factor n=1 Tax=Sphingorhabdus pulchriflava TaxID=2292257 RepID=A0A371BGT9_9SPHN|nr:trigger factor [Sphingorhabdus pulchriflava]RDV06717.1 trigger factor [Sphingorhabdus pulchriflava]
MQAQETQNEGLKRAYRLTVTVADIESRIDAEVQKIAPQVRMPGFRPGKVPANLVKKMHKDALLQEALNTSIQEGVQKTITDNKLRPATQPHVHLDHDYAPGKDAVVDFHFEILPSIPEVKIEGLSLERLTVEAEGAEIDAALERLASGHKNFETAAKSHKAATGDVVVIDFEGKVDGVPFDGGKGEGMSVELGSGQLIPGFEDQLVGVKANDSKVIKVTFPDDYGAKELAGKAATFDIVVGEVKKPVESKADDSLAQAFGLESLDKLKELMKIQVEQELNGLTRTYMKRQLLDQLAADHDFEVPPSMVEAEFEQIWSQLEQEADREEDPEAARKEMEAEREDYRDIAVRRVRLGLLLSEIGQGNGVEVSNQEMQMLVTQASQQYRPEDRQRFVQYLQENPMAAAQLRAPLFEDKVVDFLFDKAIVSEKTVTRAELEAAIEAEPEAKPSKKAPAKKAAAKKEAVPAKEEKPAAKKAAPKKEAAKDEGEKPAKKAPAKKAAAKK